MRAIPFALILGGALSIGSALIGSDAASSAADTQAAAADRATKAEMDMFNTTQKNLAPYMSAGGNALTQLLSGIGAGGGNPSGVGPLNAPFSLAQFQNSPGYQFQLQEGTNALLNNRAATGGVNSGNTLKALMQYGQGLANQDYWNAYNAYTNSQNQKFGQLQTIAGSGQNAAAGLGSLGAQVASSVGNNIIGAGNAQAAGQVGSANAINSGLNNVGGNFMLATMMNANNPNAFSGISGVNNWINGLFS